MDEITFDEEVVRGRMQEVGLSEEDQALWIGFLKIIPNQESLDLFVDMFENEPEKISDYTALLNANITAVETGDSSAKDTAEKHIMSNLLDEAHELVVAEKNQN